MRKVWPLIFCIGMVFGAIPSIIGQDIHFSQAMVSPALINPSETGQFQGTWRITNQYRNQWSALSVPFRTLALGIEKQQFSWLRSVSGGFFAFYDESGSIGLKHSALLFSASLNRNIAGLTWAFGVQAGYHFRAYRQLGTLPEQWDPSTGQFNPDLPYSEPGLGESASFPDLNLGVSATRFYGTRRITGGLALFHVLRPDVSFSERKDQLPFRYSGHLAGQFGLDKGLVLLPGLYYSVMAGASEGIIGSGILFPVIGNPWSVTGLTGGFHLRTGLGRNVDALIFSAGLDFLRTRLVLSYDVNVSGLRQSTRFRGAFEVSLVFLEFSRVFQGGYPCTRY